MQVSFVIPVYNQLAHTQACLASLREHVPASITHEIILIDDGSDALTREYLAGLNASIQVLGQEKNQGFAKATNRGIDTATGDWVCLLNNDITLTPGTIEAMLEVRRSHRDAGLVGNIQLTADANTVDHAGIDFVDGGYPRHRRGDLDRIREQGPIVRVPAITAACCLVDRRWMTAMGGLDERYLNGFEDVDLCLRAREAGWAIYVATGSVVHHAVSASERRGNREYRNARKFLERWGPRVAQIEIAERKEDARRYRVQRARRSLAAPRSVQQAHRQVMRRQAQLEARRTQPGVAWVDLLRMSTHGANGGIKPLVYSLVRTMTQLSWQPLRFVLLVQPELCPEIDFLRSTDVIASRSPTGWTVHTDATTRPVASLEALTAAHAPEVLWCPFGTSKFSRPNLPSVALLVDCLHRDLPTALSREEVDFREENFRRVVADSSIWIQTLAQHGTDRLCHHYGLHPTRCFHTHAAVHERLAPCNHESPIRPGMLPARPFFFYPANFWPHKNHEVLLTAYYRYRARAGEDAWPLLLTGHPDRRMETLREMSAALGLDDVVTFAGHLPDDVFKSVWTFAGALVFPSLHEGFGIPLVEAFHHRLPVLAGRISVLPEVGGDGCHWFDPRDPADLAEALALIAADPDRRNQLTDRGASQLDRFSVQGEARRLNHFLYAAARQLVP